MEFAITKSEKTEQGTFITTIAKNSVVEVGGFKSIQKDWYYIELAEQAEVGPCPKEFDISAFGIRESQTVDPETGVMRTFKWLTA